MTVRKVRQQYHNFCRVQWAEIPAVQSADGRIPGIPLAQRQD